MLTKTQPDEIQGYLSDASFVRRGRADRVVFPESADDVAQILAEATRNQTPVTVSGAGTGTVAGRVPFGGIVLATDKLNRIGKIIRKDKEGLVTAEAGVRLNDLQRAVESEGLLYPPDPTEGSCFIGGNVATNASGARTFKYGPTRNYVAALKIVLATGEVVSLHRGNLHADDQNQIALPLSSGRTISAQLPSYQMPRVRKHAAGYYIAPRMDFIDLFIGSEGTLGVIVEAELKLIDKPEGLLSGVVFFTDESNLLEFIRDARERSLANRDLSGNSTVSESANDRGGGSPTVRESANDRGRSPTVRESS